MRIDTIAENRLDWFMSNIMPYGVMAGLSLILVIMIGFAGFVITQMILYALKRRARGDHP
jgi:hypothetical protein